MPQPPVFPCRKTSPGRKTGRRRGKDRREGRRRSTQAWLLARVIVLKVPGTSVGHTDETLVMNVRSRINRTEAMFFPEVDVYQAGRKLPDRTVVPTQQPAIVPDSAIPTINAAVAATEPLTWDSLDANQWAVKANQLKDLTDAAWFVDRVELREPMFRLYAQIGRAAEFANIPIAPFYENIGNITVPYYWYLAALLAYQEPSLLNSTDQETLGGIKYQLSQLRNGAYPSYKGDFQRENNFDIEEFLKTYELYVNGIPMEPDGRGQIDPSSVRPTCLKRKDTGTGSPSAEDRQARREVLLLHGDGSQDHRGGLHQPVDAQQNDCLPEVDGDILTYLAI